MAHDRMNPAAASLTLLVRAFAGRRKHYSPKATEKEELWPESVLLLDTETTTDPSQRLLFGSYQFAHWDGPILDVKEEGLFHADDLAARDSDGLDVLTAYAESHGLKLQSRQEFVERVLWRAAYRARSMVVGFNLPFDLSRLALDHGAARGRDRGGFSFVLWDYEDPESGIRKEHPFRPRLIVHHRDSKGAFVRFGGCQDMPKKKRTRGRFLDARTLAFALTSESLSLQSACNAFGAEQGKGSIDEHGVITPEYVAYNRQDVTATRHLIERLREEFAQYPVALDPCKAYSPASIAKACYKVMGIRSPMERFANIPDRFHGWSMVAYYGGRAEARIRRFGVPVVYLDVLSMYPTVNALMNIWRYVTAESLELVDVTDRVQRLLEDVQLGDCFDPELWKQFTFLAEIEPDGDVLPVRARYDGQNTNIGLNYLDRARPTWYAGPDLIASKLLTGKAPKVLRAFALEPVGTCEGLQPIHLGLGTSIDPNREDFFRRVIELRKSLKHRPEIDETTKERLGLALKIIANSGSYGVFAEMQPQHRESEDAFTVHGLEKLTSQSDKSEKPGAFTFPFFAALTTAAARLMLAMAERKVTDAGGSYAFCDTDSIAIVATKEGGSIDIDGEKSHALSWTEVEEIQADFQKLSPYDPEVVKDQVLEIEEENYIDGEQIELHVYVISAKRYVLYQETDEGRKIIKGSEHGLGHLLNPTDPTSENRKWMDQVWEYLLATELDEDFEEFGWFDRPALSRINASSPQMLNPFRHFNDGRDYGDQITPFNFVLSAHVAPLGYPVGADPTQFHLVTKFESDASKWKYLSWIDRYSGAVVPVTTEIHSSPEFARLQRYRDVIELFRTHPELKSADRWGNPCGRATRGILRRRHIREFGFEHIGKESYRFEEVEKGLVHDPNEVTISYHSDGWTDKSRERLKDYAADEIAAAVGVSPRWIKAIRNGKREPSAALKVALLQFLINRKESAA